MHTPVLSQVAPSSIKVLYQLAQVLLTGVDMNLLFKRKSTTMIISLVANGSSQNSPEFQEYEVCNHMIWT